MKTIKIYIPVVLLTLAMFFAVGCTKPNDYDDDNVTPSGNDDNNGSGTGTGDDTYLLPSVQTISVNDISMSSAVCEALVDDEGGSPVTERGICWGTYQDPTVSGNHTASGNGTGSFSVTISGLNEVTTYHVRAYAINSKGTAYGSDLTFTTSATSTYPNGVLPGVFSVSYSQKVRFAQGNLQYNGRNEYWRFADHQWEHLGNNGQATSIYATRDLFAWGTSGWDCGNTYYMPYDFDDASTGFVEENLYGPPGTNSLTGQYANSDWGVYNAIVNGGNRPNQWRTLTSREWNYVFKSRNASTVNGVNNARYMLAVVHGEFGVILFPDTYNHPSGVSAPKKQNINTVEVYTNNFNQYGEADWLQMENAGCVFLPLTGILVNEEYSHDYWGLYWSSTSSTVHYDYGTDMYAMTIRITKHLPSNGGEIVFDEIGDKGSSYAVRLVQEY